MKRAHSIWTMFALSLAAAPVVGQDPTLVFTPRGSVSTYSLSAGAAKLSQIGRSATGVVTPDTGLNYSAEKLTPGLGWQTLVGDEDGDGDVYSTPGAGIDAIMVKPEYDPQTGTFSKRTDVDWLDYYISPASDVGTNVSGAPGLRRGDCGKFVRTPAGNGRVEHFIRAEQIIAVLGLHDQATGRTLRPRQINIDAITMDEAGNIFLSFEEDVVMRINYISGPITQALGDGGVAWIPPSAWTPDARGNVGTVVPNGGRLGLAESTVSGWTGRANSADAAGQCVFTLSDLDGLAIDPNGGTFTMTWGSSSESVPNLLFCGEELTGGGILSTAGYGTIPSMNGVPLAEVCGAVTSGFQIGVRPDGPAATTTVGSLDGLCVLDSAPDRFVLDSSTPTGLGGAIEIEIGSSLNVPFVWLMLGPGALPVSPSLDLTALLPSTRGFPELYPAVLSLNVPVAMVPDGHGGRVGQWSLPFSAVVPNGALFQAVTITSTGLALSSPVTLH